MFFKVVKIVKFSVIIAHCLFIYLMVVADKFMQLDNSIGISCANLNYNYR